MEDRIDASVLDEKCENCDHEFEDGEEYWWVEVEEQDVPDEHIMLCDGCYKALLEAKGIPHIKEQGDNDDSCS
jgi:hypothetical protein